MDTLTITFIVSTITGFVTFYLGTKKKSKELIGIDLTNLEHSIKIYQTIITDMKEQIDNMSSKIDKLESTVDELVKENNHLKNKLVKVSN